MNLFPSPGGLPARAYREHALFDLAVRTVLADQYVCSRGDLCEVRRFFVIGVVSVGKGFDGKTSTSKIAMRRSSPKSSASTTETSPKPVIHPLQMYQKVLDAPNESWPVFPSLHRPTLLSQRVRDELDSRGYTDMEIEEMRTDRSLIEVCVEYDSNRRR